MNRFTPSHVFNWFCFLLLLWIPCATNAAPLTLTILHTNDIRSHFEEFNTEWEDCSVEDSTEGRCFGGWARLHTKIEEIRKKVVQEGGHLLLLDAGNQFGGTLWFTVYEDEATSYFMNHTRYDAMSIGNHEFDIKPAGLAEFLKDAAFPVVSCNLDDSKEQVIKDLYKKSHVFDFGDEQVAVVGYTYWNTGEIAPAGDVVFLEEEESIQKEINDLQRQGINKIIALGHSGIVVDERIGKSVEGVDLIVGGDEQFFFYTGEPPSNDVPKYDYPLYVTAEYDDKVRVPVVQAYKYGKYLGRVDVTFDDNGKLRVDHGSPILLDTNVHQDNETLKEIQKWAQLVDEFKGQYVGTTNVILDGHSSSCRRKECNLGNLVADAYIQQHLQVPNENRWNDVGIALMNAGGIRTSVQPGDILASHVNELLPYGSTIDTLEIEGRYLLEALEKSVSEYDDILHGRFLHFSGLRVIYDLTKSPMKGRVFSVEVLCTECSVPVFEPLDKKKIYKVLTTSFIADGGDGYDMIDKHKRYHETGPSDVVVLSNYMRQISPLYPTLDRRLTFFEDGMGCSRASSIVGAPYGFIITSVIVCVLYMVL